MTSPKFVASLFRSRLFLAFYLGVWLIGVAVTYLQWNSGWWPKAVAILLLLAAPTLGDLVRQSRRRP